MTSLIPSAHNVDAVDAVIRFHDDGYVSLVKYDAGPNPISYVDMGRDTRRFPQGSERRRRRELHQSEQALKNIAAPPGSPG
ncbi:MAG TPA: hypothetical protein VIY49_06215 [Bryobacteraceae bacterium]